MVGPIGNTYDWSLPTGGAQPAPTSGDPPSPPTPLDTDGDGIPDAAELLAGTNPLDPASTFHIHSLQPAADGMHLQFPTVPGKTYRVEYSEDLTQNRWQILLDHIPAPAPSAPSSIRLGRHYQNASIASSSPRRDKERRVSNRRPTLRATRHSSTRGR